MRLCHTLRHHIMPKIYPFVYLLYTFVRNIVYQKAGIQLFQHSYTYSLGWSFLYTCMSNRSILSPRPNLRPPEADSGVNILHGRRHMGGYLLFCFTAKQGNEGTRLIIESFQSVGGNSCPRMALMIFMHMLGLKNRGSILIFICVSEMKHEIQLKTKIILGDLLRSLVEHLLILSESVLFLSYSFCMDFVCFTSHEWCAICMIIDPNKEIFCITNAWHHLGAILLISFIDHISIIHCHLWMIIDVHKLDVMCKMSATPMSLRASKFEIGQNAYWTNLLHVSHLFEHLKIVDTSSQNANFIHYVLLTSNN